MSWAACWWLRRWGWAGTDVTRTAWLFIHWGCRHIGVASSSPNIFPSGDLQPNGPGLSVGEPIYAAYHGGHYEDFATSGKPVVLWVFSTLSAVQTTCCTDFFHGEVAVLNRFIFGSKIGLRLISDFLFVFGFGRANAPVRTFCLFFGSIRLMHRYVHYVILTPFQRKCHFHVLMEVTTLC
jgi:hypothetical protein